MFMSDECRKSVTEPSEGLRLRAYQDSVGVWTNGYGHTGRMSPPPVHPGDTCTQATADLWLSHDLLVSSSALTKLIKVPYSQHQFDALNDWLFNVGAGAAKTSTVIRLFNEKNYAGSADALLSWNRAGGRILQGLVRRRALERAWFLEEEPGEAATPSSALFAALEEPIPHVVDHPDGWWTRAKNYVTLATKKREF